MRKIKLFLWGRVLDLGGMSCVVLMFVGAVGMASFIEGKAGVAVALAMWGLAVLYVEATQRRQP